MRKANKRSQDAEKARIKAQRDAEIFERNKQAAKKYFDIINTQNASDAIDSLFELLVPRSGKAETVAGEVIRAVAKIGHRWYNDGDVWLFGYGYETCGEAISYLMENCDSVDKFLNAWHKEWDEISDSILYDTLYYTESFDKRYEPKLDQLYEEVVKWLLKHPEAFTTANDSDMLQSEVAYDELTFTYDHVLDNDLINLYDDGYIKEGDIIEELFGWKYYNSEPYIEMSEVYIDNAKLDDIIDIREIMDDTDDGHTVYEQWIRKNGNPYDEDDEEEDDKKNAESLSEGFKDGDTPKALNPKSSYRIIRMSEDHDKDYGYMLGTDAQALIKGFHYEEMFPGSGMWYKDGVKYAFSVEEKK